MSFSVPFFVRQITDSLVADNTGRRRLAVDSSDKERIMFGNRIVRRVGLVALVGLLSISVAPAVAWRGGQGGLVDAPRSGAIEREGGLKSFWHFLVRVLSADWDNRGSLDPNG
jgi:hypothetical protein